MAIARTPNDLTQEELDQLILSDKIYKKSLFSTFNVMGIVGFIDFLDLAAVFFFKVFVPTMFMAAIPYLMLETGLAALSNIATFWLVAHFDRHKANHPQAGQMKTGSVVKAAIMTVGASLIVTAAIFGFALPFLAPYVLPIFTTALALGAFHNLSQTIYNAFKYQKCKTNDDTKNIANKIYNHFFVALALGLSLVGAVSANYLGMLSLGVLAVVGGGVGALYCLANLFSDSKPAIFFKNTVYRCLGLSAAIDTPNVKEEKTPLVKNNVVKLKVQLASTHAQAQSILGRPSEQEIVKNINEADLKVQPTSEPTSVHHAALHSPRQHSPRDKDAHSGTHHPALATH